MQTMLAQQKAIMKPTEKAKSRSRHRRKSGESISGHDHRAVHTGGHVRWLRHAVDCVRRPGNRSQLAHPTARIWNGIWRRPFFGGLVGAILFGMAGDRFGRRPTLLLAIVLLAVGSLITPLADSIFQLSAIRFATGLGLGGGVPLFVALTAEYAPKRLRTTLVAVMFCGFPMGAVLGGIASAKLIPAFGWPSVFIAGGVLPLLLLPFFSWPSHRNRCASSH
ncbi:MFS transporter [Undibacterium arcticum]